MPFGAWYNSSSSGSGVTSEQLLISRLMLDLLVRELLAAIAAELRCPMLVYQKGLPPFS